MFLFSLCWRFFSLTLGDFFGYDSRTSADMENEFSRKTEEKWRLMSQTLYSGYYITTWEDSEWEQKTLYFPFT